MTLLLLVATLAPQHSAAQTVPCAEELIMQPGQSLAAIAAQVFGTQDAVADIIAATNAQAVVNASFATIDHPDTVEAGWKICIPPAHATTVTAHVAPAPLSMRTASRGAIATNLASSRSALAASHATDIVPLEQNAALMQEMIAARLGDDGLHPLSIDYLRAQEYPGSTLTIEETLPTKPSYRQYLVSYLSEELTLNALMTVPRGKKPSSGWPVVIFVHGYIDPAIYSPTSRYTEYIDAIASSGYIVLRPDLRGHGDSEGEAYGAYGDPGYTIDVLNALASIQQYPDADPARIGLWGHSMGGFIAARAMVVSKEIRAGVVWAGVVAPYEELVTAWGDPAEPSPLAIGEMPLPSVLLGGYGRPENNPTFWQLLSANAYAADTSGPVQLHQGTADTEVPVAFSDRYYADLLAAGKVVEYYVYEGDDHNITTGFDNAMRRSLEFLDTHVKQPAAAVTQVETSTPTQQTP